MWVFDWLIQLVKDNPMTKYVMGVCLVLLFVAALIGFCCRDRNFYLSFAVMIVGGALIVFIAAEKPLIFLCAAFSGLCFLAATYYALMTCALMIRTQMQRRKKRRAEILRKVQYTLPDKDNTYIRTRLNTALNKANAPVCEAEKTVMEKGNKEDFHTTYAKKLLGKIQEAPLTKAERLEMEEVSRLFSAFMKKSRWTVEDVRLMNDMFAYLLKISAKYAV
jgi:hypothetical protein